MLQQYQYESLFLLARGRMSAVNKAVQVSGDPSFAELFTRTHAQREPQRIRI